MVDFSSRIASRLLPAAPLCVAGAGVAFALGGGWVLAGFALSAVAALVAVLSPGVRRSFAGVGAAPWLALGGAALWLIFRTGSALVPSAHVWRTLGFLAGMAGFWACSRAAKFRPAAGLPVLALGLGMALMALWPGPERPAESRLRQSEVRTLSVAAWFERPMTGIGLGGFEPLVLAALGPTDAAGGAGGWRSALAESGIIGAAFALAFVLLIALRWAGTLRGGSLAARAISTVALATGTAAAFSAAQRGMLAEPSALVLMLGLAGVAWGASFASEVRKVEMEADGFAQRRAAFGVRRLPARANDWPRIAAAAAVVLALVGLPAYYEMGERAARNLPRVPEGEAALRRADATARRYPWNATLALKRAKGLALAARNDSLAEDAAARTHAAFAAALRRNPLNEDAWVAWADSLRGQGRLREMRAVVMLARRYCPASPRLALHAAWAALLLRDQAGLQGAWAEAVALAESANRQDIADAIRPALARFLERAGNDRAALDAWCADALARPQAAESRTGIIRVAGRLYRPASERSEP